MTKIKLHKRSASNASFLTNNGSITNTSDKLEKNLEILIEEECSESNQNKYTSSVLSLSQPSNVSNMTNLLKPVNTSNSMHTNQTNSNLTVYTSCPKNSKKKLSNNKNAQKDDLQRIRTRLNQKFHQLFPSVSINESVVETYKCAYSKSLNLQQGVMFLTRNYICFYSKILTAENILIIKLEDINSITKAMHALIFPTALRIETQNSSYSFTSFRSRSHTLDKLLNLLNQSKQNKIDQHSKKNKSINEEINEKKFYLDECAENYNKCETNEIDVEEEEEDDDENNSLSNFSTNEEFNIQNLKNNKNYNYFHQKTNGNTPTTLNYYNCNINTSNNLIYDFDYSTLSMNKVTVSLRHKKTLIQKVKILLGLLIPGFFDISRIDSLLPICFLMCVLLLLNAFVLLNKVNQVDELFSELLIKQ